MATTGGDIIEISYSNPNVGSGTLYIKSGETSKFDLGGLRNEVAVDGAGQTINKKTRAPWTVEVSVAWDMNTRQDMEKLVSVAADLEESTWDITHINGSVYSGSGMIEGDLSGDGMEASIPLVLRKVGVN